MVQISFEICTSTVRCFDHAIFCLATMIMCSSATAHQHHRKARMQASNILPNGGQIISSLVLERILLHNKVVSKKKAFKNTRSTSGHSISFDLVWQEWLCFLMFFGICLPTTLGMKMEASVFCTSLYLHEPFKKLKLSSDLVRTLHVHSPSYWLDPEVQSDQAEHEALQILDKVVEDSKSFRILGCLHIC